jgi:hypothetical protein
VVVNVHKNGLSLKASSKEQIIKASCLIKKDFFAEFEFVGQSFIEFCLPYVVLKHMVDNQIQQNCTVLMQLIYPVGDNKLELCCP